MTSEEVEACPRDVRPTVVSSRRVTAVGECDELGDPWVMALDPERGPHHGLRHGAVEAGPDDPMSSRGPRSFVVSTAASLRGAMLARPAWNRGHAGD